MRLMTSAALALAAFLAASPAFAQTSFSLAAGATVPVGSTADAFDVGYNAIVGIGIKPPLAPIGLRIEGLYSSMEPKSSTGGANRILGGIANLTLSGAGMPIPMGYLIAGVGMYNSNTENPPPLTSTSQNAFGFNVGAGLSFPLTGFSTFLEARFHLINTDTKSTKLIPISFGLKF